MSYAFVTASTKAATQFAVNDAFLRFARSTEYRTRQEHKITGRRSVAVSWNLYNIANSGGIRKANDTFVLVFGTAVVLGDKGLDVAVYED